MYYSFQRECMHQIDFLNTNFRFGLIICEKKRNITYIIYDTLRCIIYENYCRVSIFRNNWFHPVESQ